MKGNRRVLGVAATARAYGLVVLEGRDVVYYWTAQFDKAKSPVQNLASARKRLLSVASYLQPGVIASVQPTHVRPVDWTVPACLHLESRWIARKRQARFYRYIERGKVQSSKRRYTGSPEPVIRRFGDLLKSKSSQRSSRALRLAFEAAWATKSIQVL